MIRVEIYSKPDCHLCEEAKAVLQEVQTAWPFTLVEINITTDPALLEAYGQEIPVVFINGRKAFKYWVKKPDLLRKLQRAQEGLSAR
jgi:glutaredoxin